MKTELNLIECNIFVNEAGLYKSTSGKTKLAYAIDQVLEDFHKTDGIAKLYDKESRKIKINNAAVDNNQCLLTCTKIIDSEPVESFMYTREGQIKLDEEFEVLNVKPFKISAYECTDIPFLTERQIKAFEGIVIPIGYKNPESDKQE